MHPAWPHSHHTRRLSRLIAFTLFAFLISLSTRANLYAQSNEILPLDQVHAGMQGYARTIFAGDQIENFDLEVIGVLPNFFGVRESIILVRLKGPKVEYTGVVAGMSGSPVYLDGKLAGALSLKIGSFTKEPIAGVTPIEDVLNAVSSTATASSVSGADSFANSGATSQSNLLPSGAVLQPIETPLVFSGFQRSTLQQFSPEIQSYGFVAAQGGTSPPSPDDAHLVPGDMAGMVLVQGDSSINSACTVTAIRDGHVYLCGHPFLSFGNVQIPMARSRVVMTLASSLDSTKIVNVGGAIGTITGDHQTAVTGVLGAAPAMVPLDLTIASAGAEKKFHFEIINHPKLTPLLVALTTFNGITQNSLYSETSTFHLTGDIQLKGHTPVQIENTFAPSDSPIPDGMSIALSIQNLFNRLYTNTFEVPQVQGIHLHVESLPGHQSFTLESAWLEKDEAAPGETIRVRALLHPYRGAARIEETTIRVPEQTSRGMALNVLVSDGDTLNRVSRGMAASGTGITTGLNQIISLLNRERRNDRLYVGIFTPSPTILWDDKELPNAPLSQLNIINGRAIPGGIQFLRESLAGESSIALDAPVSGVISLTLHIR